MFDKNGKDLTAAIEGTHNGEDGTSNGTSDPASVTKAVEDLAKEPKKAVYCLACGIDCTRVRWHHARTSSATGAAAAKTKYDLCPTCFLGARHPKDHPPHEFVRLEDPNYNTIPDRDAPWLDSELILLLEGLEMFDENWNSISDYVGTRTREECVMKFLQLEIEDKYLEDEVETDPYAILNTGRLPFNQADNPVMTVVSFLAGMNAPSVTAAAAGRSIDEMIKTTRKQLNIGRTGQEFLDHSPKEPTKNEDAMDTDNAPSPHIESNDQTALSSKGRQNAPSLSSIALASAAARSASLASQEEREMTRLVGAAVNMTLQKLELKLAQFSEMENVLQAERQELERGKQQLFLDRLAFKKRVREVQESMRKMGVRGEGIGGIGEQKLGFLTVTGRAEEDARPLNAGDEGYRSYEI